MSLKKFKFLTEDDFTLYLKSLIILGYKNIKQYEKLVKELETYIEEFKLNERPKRLISADVYEDFKSRLIFTSNYLLNLLGDQSDLGISYQNYRRTAKKQKIKMLNLNNDQQAELNSITTARDWSSHIPASLLYSSIEGAFDTRITDCISFPEFKKYRGEWLVSLYEDSYNHLHGFKGWMKILKEEYTILTGKPCIIKPFNVDIREISDLQIPQISSLIQNKKIKSISEVKEFYFKGEGETPSKS